MPEQNYRIAIVGAASLRGKELAEALAESSFSMSDIVLLDDESATGQLDTSGEEVAFIQPVTPASFDRMDFVFFTSTEDTTRQHWQRALASGASIVDMTCALESEPKVLVRAPWLVEELEDAGVAMAPDLWTAAIVPAHPAALALALLLARVKDAGAVRSAWATVLEPASEHGRAAMDELHQQTVSLLSFQSLPREIYDAQVAFNLLPVLGEAAKIDLVSTAERIRRHYALLSGGRLPEAAVHLVQAPVFHGYGISLGVELERAATLEHLEAALSGEHVDVMLGDGDAPSNLSSAGQDEVLVRIRSEDGEQSRRFWIWASMDNLKIAAMNALACALDLRRLRPQGTVQ